MTPTRRLPQAITLRWLRRHGACDGWEPKFRELFPDGAPITLEADLDVLWVAVRLLRPIERRDFIIFTLRQRQPHIANLFRRIGIAEHATKVEAIDWTDLKEAKQVLDAAWDATRAAAWDATRAATWDAAWDAALEASCEATRDAAWDSAFDASWAAARDATWAAAWAATWAAARDATWAAARDAAIKEQLEWIAEKLGLREVRSDA